MEDGHEKNDGEGKEGKEGRERFFDSSHEDDCENQSGSTVWGEQSI